MSDFAPVPDDLKHVSCARAREAEYWTNRFGVTRAALEQAVEQVGHDVGAVAAYLDRHRGEDVRRRSRRA
ncbi:MAG: DUF3606 domain-containing protein [Sphingobium sp.]